MMSGNKALHDQDAMRRVDIARKAAEKYEANKIPDGMPWHELPEEEKLALMQEFVAT